MAIHAPRPRLHLATRRLRACAAAPCARRAPVPPQAARPRRVFLGLGAAFVDQVSRMASGGPSSRSFVAGARPRQGVSPVEQVSHYPPGYKQDKIVGMGMNEDELKRNQVLTDYVVQDLNVDPKLPFEDNTFDVINKCALNSEYSFSNRCFWTKAISIWTSTGDVDHAWIVGAYFHYAGGFDPPQVCNVLH
ncbi:hypothetical protein PR202_gb04995 [Eleusine coracana subsp. coracana]|uniref:Uncharacterized protein n=1 Tax=Eleusine coracana subsp. coracana TaxID=191504 RepID=A0AAV5E4A8_ELECO|nr:hypothetical protein PR202_gb04995 [Eleusine coracana subsp. coracana]